MAATSSPGIFRVQSIPVSLTEWSTFLLHGASWLTDAAGTLKMSKTSTNLSCSRLWIANPMGVLVMQIPQNPAPVVGCEDAQALQLLTNALPLLPLRRISQSTP